jgi:hypothetical protein
VTFDATMAQLDQLLQADRDRKQGSLALLRSVVRDLDLVAPEDDDPVGRDEGLRRGWTAPRTPFVPIPKRTTHGGRFGPAVMAKIRRQALAKR